MAATASATREKRRGTASRGASGKRKKKNTGWLAVWWPLLLGIAATPFAIHAASIMALAGPSALLTLYPWVLLLKMPVLGLGNGLGEILSQLLMYIQFPLYGLLMAFLLRSKRLWIALGAVLVTHAAAMLAVFLTSGHTP